MDQNDRKIELRTWFVTHQEIGTLTHEDRMYVCSCETESTLYVNMIKETVAEWLACRTRIRCTVASTIIHLFSSVTTELPKTTHILKTTHKYGL